MQRSSRTVSILTDFWTTGDNYSKVVYIQDAEFAQGNNDSPFNAMLMYSIYALKSAFLLNLLHIFSLLNLISLVLLNPPARLLNDTTAVYLWSSSTVSVVLTVSTLVAVS